MEELRHKIEQVLPDGVLLMDLTDDPHKGMVRCFVDSEETVSLDVTTAIAKSIQDAGILDEYYPDGAALEVTSIGVTEPLMRPFQYKKNVGRKLNLTFDKNGYRKYTEAELVGFNDDILYLKNKNKGQFQLALENILQAKVIVQFN
ncbi:MAG TPA: hypothetical protein QGF17_08365 [Candidatus Marinimicrobia bacterium]|jgi:ribosome maturation factor RimP|nr:hypothetical protein [Candidatus Neomarinimicrobiota bacterium]|tara:strand:+ start:15128 stop:15565 length:438 start_codon:yes stop_codon:yes gene_type:complete